MSILSTIKNAVIGAVSVLRPTPASPRRLYLSSGHGNVAGKDRGAPFRRAGVQEWEGVHTALLRRRIYELLLQWGFGAQVIVDADTNITNETVDLWKKKVRPGDLALDIHFNCVENPKASGTESFVPDVPTREEVTIAERLSDVSAKLMGIPARGYFKLGSAVFKGVKTPGQSNRGRLAWMYLNCHSVLWEVCFMTCPVDQNEYFKQFENLAAEAAGILAIWLKGS